MSENIIIERIIIERLIIEKLKIEKIIIEIEKSLKYIINSLLNKTLILYNILLLLGYELSLKLRIAGVELSDIMVRKNKLFKIVP